MAEEVLEELPTQVLEYMTFIQKFPSPPLQVDINQHSDLATTKKKLSDPEIEQYLPNLPKNIMVNFFHLKILSFIKYIDEQCK